MKLVKIWKVLPCPFFQAFGKVSELNILIAQTSTYFVFPQETFLLLGNQKQLVDFMVNGIILTGYLPVFMSKALLFHIHTQSTPSDGTLLKCFLEPICTSFRETVIRTSIAMLILWRNNEADTMGIPHPVSLKDLLQSVASLVQFKSRSL